MNFEIIETQRLILKGLSPEKMNYIFENLAKNEIKKQLGHRSDEAYEIEKNKNKNGYTSYNRSFILFLLSDKVTKQIIGRCGLHNWNKDHKRAEIGYVMEDENFKRKGLMSEAVTAIIDFGFNHLKLNRIEALVPNGNTPSQKILEKNHFVKEGLLKQHFYISDKFVDSILYAKLLEDYKIK